MKDKFTIISIEEKTFLNKEKEEIKYYPLTLVAKNGDILKGTMTAECYGEIFDEVAEFPTAGILTFELTAGKIKGTDWDRDIIKFKATHFENI